MEIRANYCFPLELRWLSMAVNSNPWQPMESLMVHHGNSCQVPWLNHGNPWQPVAIGGRAHVNPWKKYIWLPLSQLVRGIIRIGSHQGHENPLMVCLADEKAHGKLDMVPHGDCPAPRRVILLPGASAWVVKERHGKSPSEGIGIAMGATGCQGNTSGFMATHGNP